MVLTTRKHWTCPSIVPKLIDLDQESENSARSAKTQLIQQQRRKSNQDSEEGDVSQLIVDSFESLNSVKSQHHKPYSLRNTSS
jgi:hypothetical protein